MGNIESELEKFELSAAAEMWDALTPEERSQLCAAMNGKFGLPNILIIGGRKGDDGHWRNDYKSPGHIARLIEFGLLHTIWPFATAISSHEPAWGTTRLGTLVARYGEAKRLVELAQSHKGKP